MRVLILIDDLRRGGTENVLASRLRERSPAMEALVVHLFPLATLSAELREVGVETRCLRLTKRRFFEARRELSGLAREFSPDVSVCMRDVSRALFQRVLADSGAPVAVFWDNPRVIRSLRYHLFETFTARFAPPKGFAPYCSSAEIAAALRSAHGLTDVPVIHNCYDHRRFHLISRGRRGKEGKFRITCVGSVRPEKNHEDKIEIARRLKASGVDFSLTIVGAGVEAAMRGRTEAAGVADDVRLLGESGDIPAILAESDVFLSTSLSEGIPVSLLEAVATGIPCVSYAFPSLFEINDGGVLVDAVPLGDIDAAVERVLFWRRHPDKAREFGARAAAKVAERHASSRSAGRWEEFLEDAANSG